MKGAHSRGMGAGELKTIPGGVSKGPGLCSLGSEDLGRGLDNVAPLGCLKSSWWYRE